MTRRSGLLVAALFGSFLVGCVVGGAVVFVRVVVPMHEVVTLSQLTRDGSEAYIRYRFGSYPVGKAALLNYASQVASAPSRDGLLGEVDYTIDLGLTYGRLALAAQRAGEATDTERYMALAIQAYAKHGQQVTREQVRDAVERLDAAWDRRLAGATTKS